MEHMFILQELKQKSKKGEIKENIREISCRIMFIIINVIVKILLLLKNKFNFPVKMNHFTSNFG